MEEARITKKEGKQEWEITVTKDGISYTEKVFSMQDITSKLLEMADSTYNG